MASSILPALDTASHCPVTTDDLAPQVLAQLPRGMAWGTDEAEGDPTAFSPRTGFWRSFASVLAYLNQRICDFAEEIHCATVNETRADWLAEYGLPDACDPSGGDLCTKIALEGGARITDLEEVLARYGYDAEVYDPAPLARIADGNGSLPFGLPWPIGAAPSFTAGLLPGVSFNLPIDLPFRPTADAALAGGAVAGCAQVGCVDGCGGDVWYQQATHEPLIEWAYTIRVRLSASTSQRLGIRPMAAAGCSQAGCTPCEYQPDFSAIECVLDRIKQAHTRIVYETV